MGGKRKPIPNIVQLPGENSGPVWQDALGNGYVEVRNTFMDMLRSIFPVFAKMDLELPPVQRKAASVRCIPDIGHHYPYGFLAPYVQMTPEQQEAVSAAYLEIGKAIKAAYDRGNENGRDLLVGLAKGEIAISDFDAGASRVPADTDYDDEEVLEAIKAVPQQPQKQYGTDEQLRYLQVAANRLGLYDAADRISTLLRRK